MGGAMRVRAPAVAGLFYPGDADALRASVERSLAAVPAPPADEPPPQAVIVPHAGYVYSGPVAAFAYRRVARLADRVTRVVLLGPAHRVFLRGLAAPGADAFETPPGVVPLDRPLIDGLRDLPQVGVSDAAHAEEHSLEVQLPFLQVVLRRFSLVPLVVGDASAAEAREVIERLVGGPETLLVVSSDLSHYHAYATAQQLDADSCRAIEALAPERLGHDSACGAVPVRGLLEAARRSGWVAETLDLRNSGDTAGDRDRVVGYGAWSFHERAA
ncbi:MAG: AmmeMemoRadiSam system protein B [Myxococcota bacterium]